MLASVRRQAFDDWEHCLVDDGSGDPELRGVLDRAAADDTRVHVRYHDHNEGIVAATNDALGLSSGDFVAFLDHDDELNPHALAEVAAALAAHPDADCLYTDEDKIDGDRRHFEPFVKPGWSPDRLRTQMYIGHLCVVRRSFVEDLGGLREGFEGAQDWDLVLRMAARTERIVNVPGIHYHWRAIAGSEANAIAAKPWAHEASRRAVAEDVERLGIQARVETIPGYPGLYWLRPALVDRPLVSIVILCGDRARGDECARRIAERSTYEDYEPIVASDGPASTRINRAVQQGSGDQILLLDERLEVPPPGWRPAADRVGGLPAWGTADAAGRRDWIESLLVYALQAGVGAAGAKVFDAEGRIRHAGLIVRGKEARCPYRGLPGSITGYGANQLVAANFIAVSAVGMMTSRETFDAAGGFDEDLPRKYAEIDYCLKLRQLGLRSVSVPQVELIARGAEARDDREPGTPAAIDAFHGRWSDLLEVDPFYRSTFLDDDFTLPSQAADGGFRPSNGPGSYLDKVRRAYGRSRLRDLVGRVRG